MHELGKQLKFFVEYKINTDPLYQKVLNHHWLMEISCIAWYFLTEVYLGKENIKWWISLDKLSCKTTMIQTQDIVSMEQMPI